MVKRLAMSRLFSTNNELSRTRMLGRFDKNVIQIEQFGIHHAQAKSGLAAGDLAIDHRDRSGTLR